MTARACCLLLAALAAGCGGSRETIATTARSIAVSIAGRTLSGPDVAAAAPGTIRVTQGERVALAAASDEAVALHLHGYDRHLDIAAGQRAVLGFDATAAGRFAIEGHYPDGTEKTLAYLEVHPR